VLFSFNGNSADSLSLIRSIPTKASLMSTDALGNLYVVKERNQLVRYNAKGDSTGIFNEIRKGRITKIDATNPLRILLYFQDYNQIVVLDQMLSKKNVIKLNGLGLFNVTAIANSADGMIWVYDAVQSALMKVDDKPSIRYTSALRNVLNYVPNITSMIEDERNLYAADQEHGVLKFDLFGFYITTFPIHTNAIQCFNSQLVYSDSTQLHSYHTQTLRERTLNLPDSNFLEIRAGMNYIWLRKEDEIKVYRYDP
jgi:hypothetical protein